MSASVSEIVFSRPISIDQDWGVGKREPARPVHLRPTNFAEQFDSATLWFDQFVAPSGNSVVLIGPPLFNLEQSLADAGALFFSEDEELESVYSSRDRCSEIWLACHNPLCARLALTGENFRVPLSPQQNHSDWFSGRRVACTLSKDNDLQWIRDWAAFYVKRHGLDAVLLYDNGSTRYSLEDLRDTISSVPGISTAVVVAWPFLYGPQGRDSIPRLPWDSDFCQHAALSHARWRFLTSAKCVLNCDIDELVVTPKGTTIFSICESADQGYVAFNGRWGFMDSRTIAPQLIRHQDHVWTTEIPRPCPQKWAAVPSKVPASAQWQVHKVSTLNGNNSLSDDIFYWHFRSLSNSWKYKRSPEFGPKELFFSEELAGMFTEPQLLPRAHEQK